MRLLHSFVCLTTFVLLHSVGNISIVSGTTVTSSSATVESVGGNQHDLSAKRLLRANETSPEEDRTVPIFSALYSRVRFDSSIVKQYMPKTGVHATEIERAWVLINGNKLRDLVEASKAKHKSLFSIVRNVFGDEAAAYATIKAKRTMAVVSEPKKAVFRELLESQAAYWKRKRKSYSDVFKILRFNDETSLEDFVVKVTVLDDYIKLKNRGQQDDESLFNTLFNGFEDKASFLEKISYVESRDTAGLANLQNRFIKFFAKKYTDPGAQFFETGKMNALKANVFHSPMLIMLRKIYVNEGKLKFETEKEQTIGALRLALKKNDDKLAHLFTVGLKNDIPEKKRLAADLLVPYFQVLEKDGITFKTPRRAFNLNDRELTEFMKKFRHYNENGALGFDNAGNVLTTIKRN